MNDFFKGFEQLLELAKTLEEKAESGELKTNMQINARGLSSIPRQGNIPDIGVSRMNRNAPGIENDPAVEEVIITHPPLATGRPPHPPHPLPRPTPPWAMSAASPPPCKSCAN